MRIIKSFSLLFFICVLVIQLLHNSCSDEGTNPNDTKFVLPESNVSFYEHIEPLFNARCGLESGCHSLSDVIPPEGRDYFLTYDILVTHSSFIEYRLWTTQEKIIDIEIDRLNPQSAKLFLILYEGYPQEFYDQMPPPNRKEPLNENQLNGIRQWISEGAPE